METGRSPYGGRGLKYFQAMLPAGGYQQSLPVWGAWIEIVSDRIYPINLSLPVLGAWIEIIQLKHTMS